MSLAKARDERRWLRMLGTLNEAQARLYVADKALDLGRGGVSRLAVLAGMSRTTITKGIAELQGRQSLLADGRVRAMGGGRKPVEHADPAVLEHLEQIVGESTAGDPESPLRWTSKATRTIAEELRRRGHPIGAVTVGRCLQDMGYSLQANRKAKEGRQHEDRDAQFRYIARRVQAMLRAGAPVISVDTKKKELVGEFRNGGRQWRKKGEPEKVNVHDFPSMAEGKAIPYGAYDIGRNRAVVNIGISHDTAEFAVESIRRWWRLDGRRAYARANALLVCADSGGSNAARSHAWKVELQKFSNETALPITVCHYPPGTSKWNKIEHRLFSFINLNWRGRPLVNYETVVNLIGATRTRSGLRVKAVLDTNDYPTGVKIAKAVVNALNLEGHSAHPEWNYTIKPSTDSARRL